MSRKNGTYRRKRRFHRWLAIMLTVFLLAGQGQGGFALAEETLNDVPPKTVDADGEIPTDVLENDNELDDQDSEDQELDDQPEDNTDELDKCICGTKCAGDSVNAACPVCAADYAACAQNATLTEEMNDLVYEEAGIAPLALPEEVEPYAEGVTFDFEQGGIRYKVIGDGEVEVIGHEDGISGPLSIPEEITVSGNILYRVTSIGENAFEVCRGLTGALTIPDSVTSIGDSAFIGCSGLTGELTIPDSVTSIGKYAFYGCSGLTGALTIPNSVTSIGESAFRDCSSLTGELTIPNSVTSIGRHAFRGCNGLTGELTIPNSVTKIERGAFELCGGLTKVTISNRVTSIGEFAFQDCLGLTKVTIPNGVTGIGDWAFCGNTKLTVLQIVVPSVENPQFPTVGAYAFLDTPQDRYIQFVDTDKNVLTGKAYDEAFEAAAKSDGYLDDSKWYGWSYKSSTEVKDTYTVTINVKKDVIPWEGHGKAFALQPDSGGDFLKAQGEEATDTYKISQVPNGDYSIYDIPLSSGARAAGMDTGVDVTVQDADVDVTVDYYTVTFYDGADAYGTDTPQKPHIVLSGKTAAKPADPEKTNWRFAGWKTTEDGGTSYDFTTPVSGKTDIFASWQTADTPVTMLTITATAEEGGSIDPSGIVNVKEGDSQSFTITPDAGKKVKEFLVDGTDRKGLLVPTLAGAAGYQYTFANVTQSHTICVTFENDGDTPGGGGDNPNPGGDDNDNPNPGGGGDNNNPNPGGGNNNNPNPGGGSSDSGGGSGDHSSDSGNGSSNSGGGDNSSLDDGNSTGGNDTNNTQMTVVSGTTIQQSDSGTAGATAGGNSASDGSNAAAPGQAAGGQGSGAPNGTEPKTGDAAHMEVYATLAMIAGLVYLLLYFMDEARGMSEREKDAFVAAFIRWGKKGGIFRKCCAMAAIFCLLAYYHAVGKHVEEKKNIVISF